MAYSFRAADLGSVSNIELPLAGALHDSVAVTTKLIHFKSVSLPLRCICGVVCSTRLQAHDPAILSIQNADVTFQLSIRQSENSWWRSAEAQLLPCQRAAIYAVRCSNVCCREAEIGQALVSPQQYGIWNVSGLGLVIAFRGTASSEDVFIDANITPVPLVSCTSRCWEKALQLFDY